MRSLFRLSVCLFLLALCWQVPVEAVEPVVKVLARPDGEPFDETPAVTRLNDDCYVSLDHPTPGIFRLRDGEYTRVKAPDGAEVRKTRGILLPVDGKVVFQGALVIEDKFDMHGVYAVEGTTAKPVLDKLGNQYASHGGIRSLESHPDPVVSAGQHFMRGDNGLLYLDGWEVTEIEMPEGRPQLHTLGSQPLILSSEYDGDAQTYTHSWHLFHDGGFKPLVTPDGDRFELVNDSRMGIWTRGDYFYYQLEDRRSKWPGVRGHLAVCCHVDGVTVTTVEFPETVAFTILVGNDENVFAVVEEPLRHRLLKLEGGKVVDSTAYRRPGKFASVRNSSQQPLVLYESSHDLSVDWMLQDGEFVPLPRPKGWGFDHIHQIIHHDGRLLIVSKPREQRFVPNHDERSRLYMITRKGEVHPVVNDDGEVLRFEWAYGMADAEGVYLSTRIDNDADAEFSYVRWID